MNIDFDILGNNKTTKKIDLFPIATSIYEGLEKAGHIDRLKAIPQLGSIRVSSKWCRSRYDYVMLQLYLHQIVRRGHGIHTEISYSNNLKSKDFLREFNFGKEKVSVGDILQVLPIVYNIGHFRNTFTSNRAELQLLMKDPCFESMLKASSDDELCRFYTPATQEAGRDWRAAGLSWIGALSSMSRSDSMTITACR